MKNILGWVKSNLVIVISLLVILISLPVGFVFSSGWNKKIRTAREDEAKKAVTDVTNTTVTYTLPAAMPGDKPMELRTVPTKALTDWFKAERERVDAEVKGVIEQAVAFNQKDRKPLIEGLFPSAASARDEEQKILDFMQELVGDPERGRASAYERLITRLGGGDKADANKIATALRDMDQRLRSANGNRALSPEEGAALREQLVDRRIGELRRRSLEVSFFASPTAMMLDASRRAGWSMVPLVRSRTVPTIDECFVYQWDYWVISDIFEAVARANTDASGDPIMVDRAPVKRVVSLNLKEPPIYGAQPAANVYGGRGGDMGSEPEPQYAFPGSVPLDRSVSVTGRKSHVEQNKVYDTRYAELTVIVSSDGLQRLLAALSQTNFMTVVDLDMVDVDAWAELREGYYYGSDHVVKATIGIETVWLRSWLAPFMTFAVANNIGADLAPSEDE